MASSRSAALFRPGRTGGLAAVMLLSVVSASRGGDGFVNVTASVGLGEYRASAGDGHGPGGVFADLDNDGFPDLVLVTGNGAPSIVFRNVPDAGGRAFVPLLINDMRGATGALAGDYDNDGDRDIYITNFDQRNALYQNRLVETGTLSFVDVTDTTDPTPDVQDDQFGVGIAVWEGVPLDNSLTAAWADVDRDGDLDLYVGNHNGWFGGPVEGPFDVPGRRDVLYLNNGDGTFTDVTMAAGAPGFETPDGQFQTENQRFSSTNAVIFADFNNDNWPDLFVTNKVGGPDDADMLYLNLGRDEQGQWLGFRNVTYVMTPPFGKVSGAAMGVDAGDYDNDGDLDIYITDWAASPDEPGNNDLYVNMLIPWGRLDFLHAGGLAEAGFSWGTQWVDVNNDGHLDLHVATEMDWHDYLYLWDPRLGLVDHAAELGVDQMFSSRGDMTADYNGDGWTDLFVVNLAGRFGQVPSVLYENRLWAGEAGANHFLTLRLVGDPQLPGPFRSTRDAIGARAHVLADIDGDGQIDVQMREVLSGSSNATSTSSLALEFGLGVASEADVVVRWPSGRITQMTGVAADQFLTITEIPGTLPGDFDGDGDVDIADFAFFAACFGGSGIPCSGECCAADLDGDGDVDIADFSTFSANFTGSQ